MNILSEESWDRLIASVKRLHEIDDEAEAEKERQDTDFYVKLLNYLEEKQCIGFHWDSDTYQEYYWWVEDQNLGRKGISTIKELVEDVFNNIHLTANH